MYLDTSNLKEISDALETGVIVGVTTNPTILKKQGKSRVDQIKSIDELGVPVIYAQLVGDNADELFEDYKALKEIGKELKGELGIKVPISNVGLKALKKIRDLDEEILVLGTAIYSADQGIMGALAGCNYLAPYYNRMENNATDPQQEIEKMRLFIDDRGLETKILAASFKNSSQVVNALISGAHTVTIDYSIFLQMTEKDVALKAIDVFNEHGRSLPK